MKKKEHIIGQCVAILLNMALLFPTSVQFLHIFENHEHTACKEIAVHLHEKKIDCSIFNFSISAFDFEINSNHETILNISFSNRENSFEPLKQRPSNHHFLLRGPPIRT